MTAVITTVQRLKDLVKTFEELLEQDNLIKNKINLNHKKERYNFYKNNPNDKTDKTDKEILSDYMRIYKLDDNNSFSFSYFNIKEENYQNKSYINVTYKYNDLIEGSKYTFEEFKSKLKQIIFTLKMLKQLNNNKILTKEKLKSLLYENFSIGKTDIYKEVKNKVNELENILNKEVSKKEKYIENRLKKIDKLNSELSNNKLLAKQEIENTLKEKKKKLKELQNEINSIEKDINMKYKISQIEEIIKTTKKEIETKRIIFKYFVKDKIKELETDKIPTKIKRKLKSEYKDISFF